MTDTDKTDKVAMLDRVPILNTLEDDKKAVLADKLEIKTFKNSEVIVKQGDEANGFFIIKSGHVVVSHFSANDPISHEIGRLRGGDFFGETALITEGHRGATVTAINGPVECFYLARSDFRVHFGGDNFKWKFAKRNAISSGDTKSMVKSGGKLTSPLDAFKEKDYAARRLIMNAVRFNVLFINLEKVHAEQIVDEMYKIPVKNGTSIIEQGDLGDNLYVVSSGRFRVFVHGELVAERGPGTCFGELALMYNHPRLATVQAVEDSEVWVVDRYTFRRIVTGLSQLKMITYTEFLAKVDLLAPLSSFEREKIAEALEEKTYEAKSTLFSQGDEGDALYLVQEGTLSITKDGEEVMIAKPGDYFGERALAKNEPRAATVAAITNVKALRLDRAAFTLLLGPLTAIMERRIDDIYDTNKTNIKAGKLNKGGIRFHHLEHLGTLGRGSYGHVTLVKSSKTGDIYALKAQGKAKIEEAQQGSHVMNEKNIMAAMEHPFLIKLWATFQDQSKLYLLLEPSLGGELFTYLRAKTMFEEEQTKFYGGCVLLAFEYMHSMNFVYRDLKPENLLIAADGYIKITDFGFAKDVSSGRTYTLCGTPEYIAPEILTGKGHGKGVDWWTLGILLFEMLVSHPPFIAQDPTQIYAKICHNPVPFPSDMSKDAKSLITKLLHKRQTVRLGVLKGGAKLIKKHAWFKTFDLEGLFEKSLTAPHVPKIRDNEDLSNFDDWGVQDEVLEPYDENGDEAWLNDF